MASEPTRSEQVVAGYKQRKLGLISEERKAVEHATAGVRDAERGEDNCAPANGDTSRPYPRIALGSDTARTTNPFVMSDQNIIGPILFELQLEASLNIFSQRYEILLE